MTILNFLRALADLGFYYSAAGVISTAAGGRLTLAAFLLQSGCFALSSVLRRHRVLRAAALFPALLLFLPSVPAADKLACVPPLLYLAHLVWTENYQLSWARQRDVFSVFWRMFLIPAFLAPLLGMGRALLAAGIPAASVTAAASVLLLRSLRHEPAVYLQRGYQAVNFAGIALTAMAALVLGSDWTLRAARMLLWTVYSYVIAPLLLLLALAVGTVLLWLLPLLQMLLDLRTDAAVVDAAAMGSAFQSQLESISGINGVDELVRRVLAALAVILTAAVLVRMFLWLSQRREDEPNEASGLTRRDLPEASRKKDSGSRRAHSVRRQYRRFLRLCRERGIPLQTADTSTDISEKARLEFKDEAALTELRELYQEARYHGASSRKDHLRCKQLLERLRKPDSPS